MRIVFACVLLDGNESLWCEGYGFRYAGPLGIIQGAKFHVEIDLMSAWIIVNFTGVHVHGISVISASDCILRVHG